MRWRFLSTKAMHVPARAGVRARTTHRSYEAGVASAAGRRASPESLGAFAKNQRATTLSPLAQPADDVGAKGTEVGRARARPQDGVEAPAGRFADEGLQDEEGEGNANSAEGVGGVHVRGSVGRHGRALSVRSGGRDSRRGAFFIALSLRSRAV
jgi:hypothetical protein